MKMSLKIFIKNVPQNIYENVPVRPYDHNKDRLHEKVACIFYENLPDYTSNNADRVYEKSLKESTKKYQT